VRRVSCRNSRELRYNKSRDSSVGTALGYGLDDRDSRIRFLTGTGHPMTSALDGGEWLAPRTGHFTLRERALGIHWTGSWVGSRAVLDAMVLDT
jgi:hypothetical protein